jgi:hypothetical protein
VTRSSILSAALLEAGGDLVGLLGIGLGVGNEDPTLGHSGLKPDCSRGSCRGVPARSTQLRAEEQSSDLVEVAVPGDEAFDAIL